MTLTLRELKRSELGRIYPLIRQLNPALKKPEFSRRLATMPGLGYHVVGAFSGKMLVGCSGFWLRTRFWCGPEMDIDNFVVDGKRRGHGIGEALLAWLDARARKERCELMVLDVYSNNVLAQRFYHRHGFTLTGYHMTKRPGNSIPWTRSEAVCGA